MSEKIENAAHGNADSVDLKIDTKMTCPICSERGDFSMTRMQWGGVDAFYGCRICFHKELDKNPMAKILHHEWMRGIEQVRDYQMQIEELAEFLMTETKHPKGDYGACDAARVCISELKAELELYESDGTDGLKSQRDFLLRQISRVKLTDIRGLLEIAIDFFPEKYFGRIGKAVGRLAELRYAEKEMGKEIRGAKNADKPWKEGNGV